MPSLCERIEIFLTEGEWLTPYISFLNSFMKRLGACLVFAVHIITALLAFTSFAIILPYEQLYQRFELLGVYSTIGVYLLINIVFHYNKARTLPPVTKAGKPGDRWCNKCEFYKSDRTHHCAVCGKCVLGMDHHCIWINQCVGSHNHRHFFLFIVFLTWATFIIVTAGFHAIWDHLWLFDVHFCNAHLVMAPLQEWLCSNGELARNLIILTYFLSLLLFLLVGGLTLWNFYLISKGFTYIDYLKHSDAVAVHPGYRNPLDKGFKNNWKTFLGLRRNRTFLRHVLLPSSHPAIHYDSYGRIERIEQQIDIV